jgi:hypothetical protein
MTAARHLGRWKPLTLAKNVESVLLPVHRPTLFKCLDLLGIGDAESNERQEHCTNADMRLRALTYVPTMWTFKDRGADVLLGSNSLEHRVQAIPQSDGSLERHPVMPLRAQCLNHFRKPYSLRVTCRHLGIIVLSIPV